MATVPRESPAFRHYGRRREIARLPESRDDLLDPCHQPQSLRCCTTSRARRLARSCAGPPCAHGHTCHCRILDAPCDGAARQRWPSRSGQTGTSAVHSDAPNTRPCRRRRCPASSRRSPRSVCLDPGHGTAEVDRGHPHLLESAVDALQRVLRFSAVPSVASAGWPSRAWSTG
jgi:hypothetical protein